MIKAYRLEYMMTMRLARGVEKYPTLGGYTLCKEKVEAWLKENPENTYQEILPININEFDLDKDEREAFRKIFTHKHV